MSRNAAFCSLAIIVFMTSLVRTVSSRDCADPDLFERWALSASIPVAAIDTAHWYRASLGWIVAPGDCAAREVALEMDAASAAFERHFGIEAPAGAVVDVAHARHAPALKKAGAAWVLPWRFEGGFEADDARAEAIRAQVRAQLASGDQAPDPDRVEALVQRALAQLGESVPPKAPPLEPKAIRHEIAHLLFMHSVWPSTRERSGQYGGDAPDWLDEAAAVVAESERMTADRREAFRELARDGQAIPLERYVRMTHPVFGGGAFQQRLEQARQQAESAGAAVTSFSMPDADLAEARAFYAQTRGFVDYLIEQSGEERILRTISLALKEGQTLEGWLAAHGAEHGLPKSIERIELELFSSREGS